VDKRSGRIVSTAYGKGRRHDFHLFKHSRVRFMTQTQVLVDTGYRGLQKLHANTLMPEKRSKKQPLTRQDKKENRRISAQRVPCENLIGLIKRFKIIAHRYRNRRKRFLLRGNIIAAIHKLELKSGEL